MATIEQFNEWERQFATANGCDLAVTLRGSLTFPTEETFSVEIITLDENGDALLVDGELAKTTITRTITNHLPMPWATK